MEDVEFGIAKMHYEKSWGTKRIQIGGKLLNEWMSG
jgi:hypothetical protein